MGRTAEQPISSAARQAVLDAAALLQVRRTEIASALAAGRPVDAAVVERYEEGHQRQVMLYEQQDAWTELLSVRSEVSVEGLRNSLPNTRSLLAGGMRMTSVYDLHGIGPDARLLLAGEDQGTYLLSVAPVQMKIVNRNHVLLQGPFRGDQGTIMAVRAPACLEAAWRYWHAVVDAGIPVAETVDPLGDLTPRQGQVISLLGAGATDDAIAAALGVSVRTVRSDVARILDTLGVSTRFAAGLRLREWSTRTAEE